MSSCIRPYIEKMKVDYKVKEQLNNLHNEVFNKLLDTKLFRKWNDYYFLPSDRAKYSQAKKAIYDINQSYKAVLASTSFTANKGKEYLFVNVKNMAQIYQDAAKRDFGEMIDDNGNQPEKDLQSLDLSKLSNVEQIMFEADPKAYLQFLKDQLYGLSNGVKVYEKGVDEKDMRKKYGDSLIDYIKNDEAVFNKVNYILKAAQILSSPKADEIFRKGDKNNWSVEKMLTELQVPLSQKELLLSFNTRNREELLTTLLANYSYTIEINTAKGGNKDLTIQQTEFNGEKRWSIVDSYTTMPLKSFKTEQEANNYLINELQKPTSHYSNLTVPGGTNYTENEIATPAITPSIKGHAQFATSNGIGWFRSDDKGATRIERRDLGTFEVGNDLYTQEFDAEKIETTYFKNGKQITQEEYNKANLKEPNFKTRRILEVQSDLFQKGRDKKQLSSEIEDGIKFKNSNDEKIISTGAIFYRNDKEISFDEFKKEYKQRYNREVDSEYYKNSYNKNQFLQLLNKENNWVTFFIKSIIQDSAKKGYEKVLFPTGNTASKVEGHSTLEEFKRQKENRIKELENRIASDETITDVNSIPINKFEILDNKGETIGFRKLDGKWNIQYMTGKSAFQEQIATDEQVLKGINKVITNRKEKDKNEINQLKQELERVEKEGFGALRPIYNFYENTVTNILKKQGYEPKLITDEYGNTWNEITLDNIKNIDPIVFNRKENEKLGQVSLNEILDKIAQRLDIQVVNITSEQAEELLGDKYNGENAFFFNERVYLVEGKYNLDAKLHEVIHPFVRAIARQNPKLLENLYKDAQNNPELVELLGNVGNLYQDFANRGKDDIVMEEKLVAIIQKEATKQLLNTSPQTKSWIKRVWDTIKYIFRQVFDPKISLDKISADTSLEDLAKILLFSDQKIDLRGKDGLWNMVFPVFNRSFIDELQKMQEKVNPQIETFYTLAKSHLQRIRTNQNLSELKSILGNEEQGNPLVDTRNFTAVADKLIGDIENDMDKLLTFAEGISSLSVFSSRMADHVDEFINRDDVGDKYKIGVLLNYSYIINDWKKVLQDFSKLTPGGKSLPLRTEILNIIGVFNDIEEKKQDYVQNIGLVKILKDDMTSNIYFMRSLKELEDRIKFLQEDYDKGNKRILDELNKEKQLYNLINPTDENIKKWLAGEMGDNNLFSRFFESYSSNPNPIVGSFVNFFYKNKAIIDSEIHASNTGFFNKLDKIFKEGSIKRNDIDDIYENITDTVQILKKDENGKDIPFTVRVLANQYAGDYQYQNDLYEQRLAEFSEKTPEYYALKKEYEQFKHDYMFDDSSDIVAKSRQFWLQSDMHVMAKTIRDEILDEIQRKQLIKPVSEEEVQLKDLELKELWRRYSRLSSMRDKNNALKTEAEQDLESNAVIADIMKQYREQFGDLYEKVEIKNAFATAKKVQEEKLKALGLDEGSEEYKKKMNAWMRDNLNISNSERFYQERQEILDEISAILSKLPDNERKSLDISDVWKQIFDVTKGFRDEDGQIIGSDLSLDQQNTIKDLQVKLEEIKQNFSSRYGLSKKDTAKYFELKNLIYDNRASQEQKDEYNYLDKMKVANSLSEAENDRLDVLYEKLGSLQQSIPTNYYIDTYNNWMDVVGGQKIVGNEGFPNSETLPDLFEKNEDFKNWFLANHRLVERYSNDSKQYYTIYERIYSWNRIIPNDKTITDLIQNEDYAGLMALNHHHISVTPSNDYFFYTLKKKYKTERIVGVTVDNRGKWLPKPTERTATPQQKAIIEKYNLNYAKDATFESKVYLKLKTDPSLAAYDKLNETYKQYHIENQVDTPNYAKLWYEVPRIRKTNVERLKPNNIINNLTDLWTLWNPFVKKQLDDALDRGEGGYEQAEKTYVMTDLFGNVPTKIPIKYTSHLKEEDISKDLGQSLIKYNVSIRTNKLLHEINPIAQTLRETLKNEKNAIKMQGAISKTFANLKYNVIKPKDPSKVVSGMYNAVNNFIEREFEGIEKKYEAGVGFDRFASHLMRLGAVGSLALAPVAAVKNLISGDIQKTLEAISGKVFTGNDLAKGQSIFFSKYIPALMKDYYSPGNRSLYTQKFELFDPLLNYGDKVGKLANISLKSDIADGKFLFSGQKLGEIEVQGGTLAIMMQNQKVPKIDKDTGEKTYISYEDAWELNDKGVIVLKNGIDKSWDKTGENFAQFKLRIQKINELLQGAYARENQAEYQRYTSGALAGFMRKYFVPMFMNRFAGKRANYALGQVREGYYMTVLKKAQDTLKNGRANWHTYSAEEKANMLRVAAEIGYSLFFAAMISLLGFDEDDDDKYKKIKDNWLQSYAIYQIYAIKSEAETFIPWYSMGFNEWLRTIKTPSIAFNVISKYMKMVEDLYNWARNDDSAYYDKAYGVYDKGDVKFLADLYSLIGIRNWLILDDPSEGVKAYVRMQRRY